MCCSGELGSLGFKMAGQGWRGSLVWSHPRAACGRLLRPWGGWAGSGGAPESQQMLLVSSWGVGLCRELETTSCGVK